MKGNRRTDHPTLPAHIWQAWIVSALLITLVLLSPGCDKKYYKYEHMFFGTFDTVIQIIGYTKTESQFQDMAKYAESRFIELNRLYDMYHRYSGVNNIKTVNDSAGVTPVCVDKEIIHLLLFSKDWAQKYPGVINIAFGPVVSLWNEYRERGLADPEHASLPPMDALRRADSHTDINKVMIDESASTVFLQEAGMSLDVGSVAKGYATELVADELHARGFDSFVINSGGNVRVVGAPRDGKRSTWYVGITNPDSPGSDTEAAAILDTAYVTDKAVTTAGDYQRYYTVNGKRYSHIIDPATLLPATRFRAVTVLAPDSGVADFLDTLLFILPYEDGCKLVKSIGGVDALWILPDGSRLATDGMKAVLKDMGGAAAR